MSANLPVDIIGHLAQYCPVNVLGILASTCRIFSGGFVWSHFKHFDSTVNRKSLYLLTALINHQARLESFYQEMFLFHDRSDALAERLGIQSAPSIKRGCIVSSKIVSHLNGTILESIELPLSEQTITLIQSSRCPNLRSLKMYVAVHRDLQQRVLPLIASLPQLEHLELSIGPVQPVVEICRALRPKLKTLHLDALGFPHLLTQLGLELTTLDASTAEQIVQNHFYIPLSGLFIAGDTFLQHFIEKVDWRQYSSAEMMDGALQSVLDCMSTHMVYLTRQQNANHILIALYQLTTRMMVYIHSDAVLSQIMPWICENFVATLPMFLNDPYLDGRRLASSILIIFDRLDKNTTVTALMEPLAARVSEAVKSLAESDPKLLERIFQTQCPPTRSLIKIFLSERALMARAGLTENSTTPDGFPLFSRCQMSAATLFFTEVPTFNAFVEINGEPFVLHWLLDMLEVPLEPDTIGELRKIVSNLAARYTESVDMQYQIAQVFLSLESRIWTQIAYRECAALFKLVPRDDLLQMLQLTDVDVPALSKFLDFIEFIYIDMRRDRPEAALQYRNHLTQRLWVRVLTCNPEVLQGVPLWIDLFLEHLPLPEEILTFYEHPEASDLASKVHKDIRDILVDRLNAYCAQRSQ